MLTRLHSAVLLMVMGLLTAYTSVLVVTPANQQPAVAIQAIYNVVDFGAVGDGNASSTQQNTTAFQNAIAAATSGGSVYVPPGKYMVKDGAINVSTPNVVLYGDGGMGGNGAGDSVTTIIGQGPGNTLTVSAMGCVVRGLAFRGSGQQGTDAFIALSNPGQGQITVERIHMQSPNVGIAVTSPKGNPTQFWFRDILMEGTFTTAGMNISAGGGSVVLDHVVMFNVGQQPPYGIVVTSAGEFCMSGACDIDNCGTNLAIVPGLSGVQNEYVNAVMCSNCLYDNGNGDQVLIRPKGTGFVLTARFSNCWTSSVNNGAGAWPGNGFTFDASQSKPLPVRSAIIDVSLSNCVAQNFVNHCGIYANGVYGLTVTGTTCGGNFNGIQTFGCVGVLSSNRCGDFVAAPLGQPTAGNTAFGILLEKSQIALANDNLLIGNVVGGVKVIP